MTSLLPTATERLARAYADLRMGLPVVLRDDSEAVLAMSAETLTVERLADLRQMAESPVLVLTARRAKTLKARFYDNEVARIVIPQEVDLRWIRALADPADDLTHPMKGPLASCRGGPVKLHQMAITLAKNARVLPAVVVCPLEDAVVFAAANDLTVLDHGQAAPVLSQASPMSEIVHARLPMRLAEAGRLHIFRPEDGREEHYAIEVGRPDRHSPVLARLHSACFTGDLLGSLKCDCGPQLQTALAQMGAEGAGVLLYLNQEGRGIGLANKMRAYSLQDQGFDTVEANHRLGFEDDERDFRIGAAILRELGFSSVRLMTNNPRKVEMMRDHCIEVTERVPLRVGKTPQNASYLATKAAKSGHIL